MVMQCTVLKNAHCTTVKCYATYHQASDVANTKEQ